MSVLQTVRLGLFAALALFSLINLGILCNLTNITSAYGYYFHSFALGIAVSLMTIGAVITSLVLGKTRKGALPALVWVELAWVGFLWVMWIATASSVTSLGIFVNCGYVRGAAESNCRQYQAVQAFAWLNWLMIFGWFVTLLALSCIAHSRGNTGIWYTDTTEAQFTGAGAGGGTEKNNMAPQFTGNTMTNPSPYGTPQPQYGQQQQQWGAQPPQQGFPPQQAYPPPQGFQQQGYPQQGGPHTQV
jgi:hypothetical protein